MFDVITNPTFVLKTTLSKLPFSPEKYIYLFYLQRVRAHLKANTYMYIQAHIYINKIDIYEHTYKHICTYKHIHVLIHVHSHVHRYF